MWQTIGKVLLNGVAMVYWSRDDVFLTSLIKKTPSKVINTLYNLEKGVKRIPYVLQKI